MDVSKNNGIPKSSILIGLSITNHPFWNTTIVGNTHIQIYPDLYPVTCSKSSEKFHTRSQQALGRLHDFAVTFEADFAAEMMLGFLKE